MISDNSSDIQFESAQTNNWIAIFTVAMAAFVIVTAEFLPVGLLTQLSHAFNETEGKLGLAVTLPGIIGAFSGPVVVFFSGNIDRKKLVIFLSFLTTISCLCSGLSQSLTVFLFGRALMGVAVGGFWSFALVLARRLSTNGSGHRASAIVGSGISLGTILGLPAGSLLGNLIGWRETFISIASVAALITILQIISLPKLPSNSKNTLNDVKKLLSLRKVRYGYGLSFLIVTAHFSGYTFLEPYLRSLYASTPNVVTVGLLVFGIFGLLGTFASEPGVKSFGSWGTYLISAIILCILLLLMTIYNTSVGSGYLFTAIWGIVWGLLPTLFGVWLFEAAPHLIEASSGLFVLVTQASVAAGSYFGGLVFDDYGLMNTFKFSSLMSGLTIILLLMYRRKTLE